MIRLSIGNVGSGKTATEVREMCLNPGQLKFFSNIRTTLPHQTDITGRMICNKEEVGVVKTSGLVKYEFSLNVDYWKKNVKEPCSVVIDEAHTILNARKFMNKVNIVVTDWLSLLRRVMGENSRGTGDLVLITQLPMRVDVICREMATQIRYHICHYRKSCNACGITWREHSDMPEKKNYCINCGSIKIFKHSHLIEIKAYNSMEAYNNMKAFGEETHYAHYYVTDIEKYFGYYNTLQWDNMLSELYE